MMRWKFFRWHPILVGLCISLSGCSTLRPVATDRHGLLDSAGAHVGRVVLTPGAASRYPAQAELGDHSSSGENFANWRWPTERPKITSPFGTRGRKFHEGVDLEAVTGTPVLAVQSGLVVYAGTKIRGYGKLIVLKHDSGILTLYAHNSTLFVKAGDRVEQGQQLSLSGRSGRVRGPHLHFEIRRGVVALNPADLLPRLGVEVAHQEP